MLGRFALAITFLCSYTVSHAQWDSEYQIGVTMTQKSYSNSLTEASSGIFGVSNDLTGIGFWIHMTDGNGKTTASFYYKTGAGTLRAYAVEAWGTTVFTAGEIDYGNGTTDVFLMSSDATGGVNNAVFVPFGTNTIATAADLVITSTTATTANLIAVGSIDKGTSKVPCSVMFDNTMSSFSTKEYDPGTNEYFVPVQAKLLDPTYALNTIVVFGNDEFSPNGYLGLFKMRINTTNGNIIGNIDPYYFTTGDYYNPSVCATIGTDNVFVAATYAPTPGVTDAIIIRFPGNAAGFPSNTKRQYDKNSGNEMPVQIHESTLGNTVLAYNYQTSNGAVIPCVARISQTLGTPGTIVVSDIEYHSQHTQRNIHAAFARSTGSSTMYFASTTPANDMTRTIASTSSSTQCQTTGDFEYLLPPSFFNGAPNSVTTTSGTIYDDLSVDETKLTGAKYDCNGSFDGSFKRSPTSIGSISAEGALVNKLIDGIYAIQLEDVNAYSVYSINGRLILENDNATKGSQINLTTFPTGVYVLSANLADGTTTQVKLLK